MPNGDRDDNQEEDEKVAGKGIQGESRTSSLDQLVRRSRRYKIRATTTARHRTPSTGNTFTPTSLAPLPIKLYLSSKMDLPLTASLRSVPPTSSTPGWRIRSVTPTVPPQLKLGSTIYGRPTSLTRSTSPSFRSTSLIRSSGPRRDVMH